MTSLDKKLQNAPAGAGYKWWSCERKRQYRTRAEARKNQAVGTGNDNYHYTVQPYKCNYCGVWHIGRRSKIQIKASHD